MLEVFYAYTEEYKHKQNQLLQYVQKLHKTSKNVCELFMDMFVAKLTFFLFFFQHFD